MTLQLAGDKLGKRTETEWQQDVDEAWGKLKAITIVNDDVLSGTLTPSTDSMSSLNNPAAFPEETQPACPFDLVTEEAESSSTCTPPSLGILGCGEAFESLPWYRLANSVAETPLVLKECDPELDLDDEDHEHSGGASVVRAAPATVLPFDWLALLHESVPLKSSTRLCGSKRSQSCLDTPPPLSCASRPVSQLGWSFSGQISPRYLYLKLSNFFRSCPGCTEVDGAAAEYELTGLYKPLGTPDIEGFCRFQLNLFKADFGTCVQSKRSCGDSFVYLMLVRRIGTLLGEIGSHDWDVV